MNFKDYLARVNHIYTGRGSTAIYLVLVSEGIRGAHVVVPANICYAAVLPIIYSGNLPVFVDVGNDGNITLEMVRSLSVSSVAAAVIPHMYGNPCAEMPDICTYLKGRGILTIEDCAVAMGAQIAGKTVGSFGDYAIYSFGYSKTIDAGYGGLITSNRNLGRAEELGEQLDSYGPAIEDDLKLWSALYRVIRNHNENDLTRYIYDVFPGLYRSSFLFKGVESHYREIEEQIGTLDDVVADRRQNAQSYDNAMAENDYLQKYKFRDGAVPWRYNILVDAERRTDLIRHLLDRKLPVSDWYPVISPMFGVHDPFPTAEAMGKRILNFPLAGIDPMKIPAIASAVNEFWDECH